MTTPIDGDKCCDYCSILATMVSGKQVTVRLPTSGSIGDLRIAVANEFGLSPGHVQLAMAFSLLDNESSLVDYQIGDGSQVSVVFAALPKQGTVSGEWHNDRGFVGQHLVEWDLEHSDKHGFRMMNNDRWQTNALLNVRTAASVDGLFIAYAWADIYKVVGVIVLSGDGIPIMRCAFGSAEDYGRIHCGFECPPTRVLAATSAAVPTRGNLKGRWESNTGATGDFDVRWSSAESPEALTVWVYKSGLEVLVKNVEPADPLGLAMTCDFQDCVGLLNLFVAGRSLVMLGSYKCSEEYGIYVGGFPWETVS